MTTTATPHEAEQLRDRVRLYLQVMLIMDVAAHLSDVVDPLLLRDLEIPEVPLYRWAVTVALAAGWSFAKFAKPSRTTLIALESGFTIGLGLAYINLALAYFSGVLPSHGPAAAMFGIALLLVVRASLVPSPVTRTVVVGIALVVCLLVLTNETLSALDPVATEGLAFTGGAFVLVTAVTSHVIYGLRKQVRDMTRLGQYTLERKLGEGGMGIVYRAHHGMLRRPTAIKLLPAEKTGAESLERFEREVQLTARLTHPNTVTVFDYGRTPEGVFYYAMELLAGATLSDVVTIDGAQPAARVARILADCAGALHEAHCIGLIHRDIKPANIMLCSQGGKQDVAKLLDFGLVKELKQEADASLTGAHVIVGTPHYMSPEAVTAPDTVDARSDIYALGAVGYYLLTGQHPFNGKTVMEICAHHLSTAPVPPSERLGRPLPPGLEALIMACLAKSPHDRPPSAAAIEDQLRALHGLGSWEPDEWWEEYAPALERLHRAEEISGTGRTLAVDPTGRA